MNNINLCMVCGCDMGDCNPRQLCRKTYCPMQQNLDTRTQIVDPKITCIDLTIESDQLTPRQINTIDDLLSTEIFAKMKESKSFKQDTNYIDFFRQYQTHVSFYIGFMHFGDQQHSFIIELDGNIIIRYVDGNWVFYIYPYVNPNDSLFIWNAIIVSMLTPECNNAWTKEGEMMCVHVI